MSDQPVSAAAAAAGQDGDASAASLPLRQYLDKTVVPILLQALSVSGGTMADLVAPYDKYAASGEINSTVADQQAAIDAVREHFGDDAQISDPDGMLVEADRWWFNLRPSNTEPLLRLNVEGDDEATMAEIRDRVLGIVRG